MCLCIICRYFSELEMNETKKTLEDTKAYIVKLAPQVQTEKLTFPIGKFPRAVRNADIPNHYKNHDTSLQSLCFLNIFVLNAGAMQKHVQITSTLAPNLAQYIIVQEHSSISRLVALHVQLVHSFRSWSL